MASIHVRGFSPFAHRSRNTARLGWVAIAWVCGLGSLLALEAEIPEDRPEEVEGPSSSAARNANQLFKPGENPFEKCDEGRALVEPVVNSKDALPAELKELSLRLRWELFLIKKDFEQAIETCILFSRLYSDSPFAGEALIGIGKIRLKEGDADGAIQIFGKVLKLRNSENKAEAMFLIAGAVEKKAEMHAAEARGGKLSAVDPKKISMPYYKRCADQFPRSLFAAPSLIKVLEYHKDAREYAQANELLEHIFDEESGRGFEDEMLLRWVGVAVGMNDYEKAVSKCQKLLFEFPSSKYAESAKRLLPLLQKRLKNPQAQRIKGEVDKIY